MDNVLHGALVDWLTGGFTAASWWQIVSYTLVTTHITISAVTIFLHRAQAHRALMLHPNVSHFFRAWLWLGTGMVTKEFVAVHRKHHAKVDTEYDPHSPQTRGIKALLLTGVELYRAEAARSETLERYGHSTPDDWIERKLYTPWSKWGVAVMLILDIILFGVIGLTVWAVQMLWIPVMATGIINGLGHWWGYRSFDPPDASTNITPWGIIIGGEELHNNHHTYPTSAKFSVHPWEFDIGWCYISLLSALGWVRVRVDRLPPRVVSDPQYRVPDGETLAVIQALRFRFLRELRQLERRHPQSVSDWPGAQESFRSLWADQSAEKSVLINRLQNWHAQAMESGSTGLRNFATNLVKLRLKPS